MKYLISLGLGVVVGALIACTGLYLNPLTTGEAPEPGPDDWVLRYEAPWGAGIAVTHGGESRLARYPAAIPTLWESTISQSVLSVVALTDAGGATIGVASRISLPSEGMELLRRGVIFTDHWLISIQGEGSFFVHADSNLWPFIKDNVLPVWYLRRPWAGSSTYRPTAGPALGGLGQVAGATGSFAGAAGSAVERYRLIAFDERVGPERFQAELFLSLTDEAPPAPSDDPTR